MTMTAIDKATKGLVEWTARDEWAPLLWQVHMDHMEAVAEEFEGGVDELLELLGDSGDMLNVFVAEDFFTARFGEDGELNVIDDYLEQRGSRESSVGRCYLESLRDSNPSLYEVVDIDPGRCLTVRDLLVPGKAVTVFEQLGSQAAAPWDRLAARIVVVNGERRFTGAILPFRHGAADRLMSAFDELVKESTRRSGKQSRGKVGAARGQRARPQRRSPMAREAIIRSLPCAEILSHFWLTDAVAQAQAPLPDLRNTDGDPLILCELRFPMIGDEAEICRLLDGIDAFERVEGDEPRWAWLAPGSPTHRAAQRGKGALVADVQDDDATTAVGHADIASGAVTLRVNSRERAERGRALLSFQLGQLIGQAVMSSMDPYELLEAGVGQPASDVEQPTEDAQQAIHAMLDDHYRRTLDEPIPMLGGKTLRRAVKTKKGREEAIGWLKQLENIEHRKAERSGQKAYDTRWIWRELGIERFR